VICSNQGRDRLKKITESYPQNRQDRLKLESGGYLKKWKNKTPIALVYPNEYGVGMSSLGFQQVYTLLNRQDGIVCERFFLPEKGEDFVSIESGRPLRDFPFILFSISFEHDYVNIVRSLLLGGIEPFSRNRHEIGDDSPLIIFGGVACFMNPEPIASFADLIVIGEAEPVLENLVEYLINTSKMKSREVMLQEAAQRFKGIYVPHLYTPQYDDDGKLLATDSHHNVPRRIERVSLEKCEQAGHSEVLTPAAEFSNLHLTELGRGCSRGCRFCAAGFIYRPPRLWDADAVVEGLRDRGESVTRIGLLGMEMANTATLEHISDYLLDSGCALSFSSLRADRINDKLYELLSQSDLKSVAIAPDGASERLRRVINKGLDADDLLKGATRLVEAGIFKLKIYVMVGLPTETCEDLQEFIDLIATIKERIDHIGRERGRLTEIFLSVNCFVPKPWTPFQYHPFGISTQLQPGETLSMKKAVSNLKEKITYLKNGVRGFSNVHIQADKPENAFFQALLSRGDRRLGQVLYDMAAQQLPWKRSLKKNRVNAEKIIVTGYDETSFFPWYIIDHGISFNYLWKEYQKGLNSALTEPCDTTVCRRCGVCGES
jgi:radical SAM superfamily enzyme YgiQ (UPF0313 family)